MQEILYISLEDFLSALRINNAKTKLVYLIDGYDELGNLIECGLIKEDSIVLRFPKSEPFDTYKYNEENNYEETDQI